MMQQTQAILFLRQLEERRRNLEMPYRILAKRAGVGMRTVQRVLSGDATANFRTVIALAEALGASITLAGDDINDVRKRQAERKAKWVVSLVQGTSALEAQAVDEGALRQMRERTVKDLLGGTRARLWDD